jgi:hypothetical protein
MADCAEIADLCVQPCGGRKWKRLCLHVYKAQGTGALPGAGRMSRGSPETSAQPPSLFRRWSLSVEARRYQLKASFVSLPLLGQLRLLQCEGTSGCGLFVIG